MHGKKDVHTTNEEVHLEYISLGDDFSAASHGNDGSRVHQVHELGTGEPCSCSGYFVVVQALLNLLVSRVHLQDANAALHSMTTTIQHLSGEKTNEELFPNKIWRLCQSGRSLMLHGGKQCALGLLGICLRHEGYAGRSTCRFGRGKWMIRSKRPGRVSAVSSAAGLFVAAMTMTPELSSKPSISVSS